MLGDRLGREAELREEAEDRLGMLEREAEGGER